MDSAIICNTRDIHNIGMKENEVKNRNRKEQ